MHSVFRRDILFNNLNQIRQRHYGTADNKVERSFLLFRPGTSIMDLGTGGGFPGIPLAILFPEVKFHLVDSIGKKVRVATEVANAIGLKNVTFRHARAEEEITLIFEFQSV